MRTICAFAQKRVQLHGAFDALAGLANLQRRRNSSPADYFAFEEFQGQRLAEYLERRGVLFEGCHTLDLACGLGGYIPPLQARDAHVVGIDFNVPHKVDLHQSD